MKQKLYNFSTHLLYKVFHLPLKFQVGLEIKPKNPELTVIFLHGISANSSTWQTTFNQLKKSPDLKNTRLVSLDLLGFGKSLKADWLDYNYAEYDSALGTALNKLKIKTPVIIIGHSMGCLIATHYAKNHSRQISELILVSPPILLQDELAKLPDKFYLKSYSSIHKIANEPAIKTLASFVTKVSSFRDKYLNSIAFQRSMENIILNPKNYSLFTNLKLKTTIIHGRLDPLVYGPNLAKVAKENPEHVKLIRVMGDHDLGKPKRDKILNIIKQAVKNAAIQH